MAGASERPGVTYVIRCGRAGATDSERFVERCRFGVVSQASRQRSSFPAIMPSTSWILSGTLLPVMQASVCYAGQVI